MRNLANKQGGGGGVKKARSFRRRSRARDLRGRRGRDEAKTELVELVDMLRNADKYKGVTSRLPTGCLLVGLPGREDAAGEGCGGEAGVPFFSVAASE